MAKLVDALDSGSSGSNIMRVRVPLAAHMTTQKRSHANMALLVVYFVLDCLLPYLGAFGLTSQNIAIPAWVVGLTLFTLVPMFIYAYILTISFPTDIKLIRKLLLSKLLSLVLVVIVIQHAIASLVQYSLQELAALLLGCGGVLLWYGWSQRHDIITRLIASCFGCGIVITGLGLALTSYIIYTNQVVVGLWAWAGFWLWIPWLITIIPLIKNRSSIVKTFLVNWYHDHPFDHHSRL